MEQFSEALELDKVHDDLTHIYEDGGYEVVVNTKKVSGDKGAKDDEEEDDYSDDYEDE